MEITLFSELLIKKFEDAKINFYYFIGILDKIIIGYIGTDGDIIRITLSKSSEKKALKYLQNDEGLC